MESHVDQFKRPSERTGSFRTVVILGVSAALVTARGEWESPGKISRYGLLMLTLSGVATGLSWLCYYRALAMPRRPWSPRWTSSAWSSS